MSLKIPKELKKEFNRGFDDYIKKMGRCISVYLKPTQVSCPNCIQDPIQKKSTNIWNSNFLRAVNIFVGTAEQKTIYPQPFNVTSASGVVYDPNLFNPHILSTAICPVCRGEGSLYSENKENIVAVVTVGRFAGGSGDSKSPRFVVLSAGRDGREVYRIKTYAYNYSICNDAKYFVIDGIKLKTEIPIRVKGLGGYHIAEGYLTEIEEGSLVTNVFDEDQRLKINDKGQVSNQASPVTPTIPPIVPGDDVW